MLFNKLSDCKLHHAAWGPRHRDTAVHTAAAAQLLKRCGDLQQTSREGDNAG